MVLISGIRFIRLDATKMEVGESSDPASVPVEQDEDGEDNKDKDDDDAVVMDDMCGIRNDKFQIHGVEDESDDDDESNDDEDSDGDEDNDDYDDNNVEDDDEESQGEFECMCVEELMWTDYNEGMGAYVCHEVEPASPIRCEGGPWTYYNEGIGAQAWRKMEPASLVDEGDEGGLWSDYNEGMGVEPASPIDEGDEDDSNNTDTDEY
ncbi:acidic leucine-rich nuclear phosphoprotein 32-related protein 1-like [Andrographis paniculata]|uniref:acidic leucine-rich nuclear phosphoprotein 32-related protein 1-like n=1 Tax=Andrographis paniculata TaxID=175694 RepID=UPI0021E8914E|nr:acidic leucine-rich nuclear phosphoprotein 32-related protein 1-like [Andrographis paniculata]